MGVSTILTLKQAGEWQRLVEDIPSRDITHEPRFCQIYEEKGDGKAECFIYREGNHFVLYPYIKRNLSPMPFPDALFSGYSDIVSPYGYGGPITNADNMACELKQAFRTAFSQYATDAGIVSEFVRFHPLLDNHKGYEQGFDDVLLNAENVIVKLDAGIDRVEGNYRTTLKHCIKKANEAGLELQRESPKAFVDEFYRLYSITMARVGQVGYLNFPKHYFELLSDALGERLIVFSARLNDQVIAAALFLKYGDQMDYFLAGADSAYFSFHPNHFLLGGVIRWAVDNKVRIFQLGGGKPSLHFFKRGFSAETASYYIGLSIHNMPVYDLLCKERESLLHKQEIEIEGYFPIYRAGLE